MNMFYGVLSSAGVPADEQEVRATTDKIDINEAPSVMTDEPEIGEVETDPTPGISGLHNHQLASKWYQGEKFTPSWLGNADQQSVNSVIVDGQVSSSGTAAARESQGIFGHGSMSYAVGIEPAQGLAPGGQFGETYLSVDRPDIQHTAGSYMSTPPGVDRDVTGLVSDTTKRNARYAKQATLYDTWLNSGY